MAGVKIHLLRCGTVSLSREAVLGGRECSIRAYEHAGKTSDAFVSVDLNNAVNF